MLCLSIPDDGCVPDEEFFANWKCLMAQFLDYILKCWVLNWQKENSDEYIETRQKIKRWEALQKRHSERMLARPKPPEPLPPMVDVDAAYRDLQQVSADRLRRKWCACLLASWRVLLDFQYGRDTASAEAAYWQAKRYFLILSRKDAAVRERPDLVTAFSDFSRFCAQQDIQLPSRIAFHREVLAPRGIIRGVPNGKDSPYLQFARQIVVSQAEKRKRVLPVQLTELSASAPLSGRAENVIRRF